MVVEDEAIIAVDYYFQLKAVGAKAAAYERTTKAALDYLAAHDVDAAIVDYQLRDGPCEALLAFLRVRGIPFIVVSGCTHEMHGSFATSQVLSKPVTAADLSGALCEALISTAATDNPLTPDVIEAAN